MFTYPIEIAARTGGPFETLEAVVDSGAFYTQAPASLLRRLGVQAIDRAVFITADGRRSEADLGEIEIRMEERHRTTICVFGEEETPALLGAYALEGFLLGVDPVNQRLIGIEGLRLWALV